MRLAGNLGDGVECRHGLVVERAYGAQVAHDAVGGLVAEGDGARPQTRPAVREAVDQEPYDLAPGAAHLGGGPVQRLELAVGDADVRRLGMASRLKLVTPRGAGHPPQSERMFGQFGRGVVPGAQTKV